MTNEPISPLPVVLPDVDLPCACGSMNGMHVGQTFPCPNFRNAALRASSSGQYTYATSEGRIYPVERVPWDLVRAALAKEQEQPKTFKVGDRVTWDESDNMYSARAPARLLIGTIALVITDGGTRGPFAKVRREDSGVGWDVSLSALRHAEPEKPAAYVPKVGDRVTWERGLYELTGTVRRVDYPEPGSAQVEHSDDGFTWTEFVKLSALSPLKPPAQMAPKPSESSTDDGHEPTCLHCHAGCPHDSAPDTSDDGYEGSDLLREAKIEADAIDRNQERLAAMSPRARKRAQDLLDFGQPLPPRKSEHPTTWPEDSEYEGQA
jgi:hypothetical protein